MIGLVPPHPPGSLSRKARAFQADIAQLRSHGYTLESIRQALAAAGVQVSLSTVITNGFTKEGVDPESIQKRWRKLRNDEPDPDPVAIRYIELVGHQSADDPRSAKGYSAYWPSRSGQ